MLKHQQSLMNPQQCHQLIMFQQLFLEHDRLLLIPVAAHIDLQVNPAKSDEPTAMPSADNVSTTVLGTRPVVALPDLQVNQQLNLAYLLFILLFIIYFY